ncbi:MAG: hypothetical protein A3B96_04250 [Candidatus Spechtbacteria bacterium RIFCSPHIGHO2_02_FULL_43_15b]|uniref:PPM-type phosphatase domain-containing protein n=1 Tax=Candidatus Spechtbacteria bacterium RIFCSPHIGHO2_01_FULL_43_30 TaxID=1802158 RepID=A0A1G2H7H2_9BACT|nr:MAG: hypothetical protein A2827_01815 [Candidatus Spechtbacteria bacterium RIFCSPHIGHO2_01_FULL_43_30]OGZ58546.1 MAG: hypothetical protein A3B96_04250 [Candidatus Spechtbacteria bacterium RIFCSPHIGHO2_02_FULL_43_15b]
MARRVISSLEANFKGRPNEDFCFYKKNTYGICLAVADGISRTSYRDPYPGAYLAAKLLCKEAIALLDPKSAGGDDDVREVFLRANACIRDMNSERGINEETVDYLEKDYYGCVGAIGLIGGVGEHQWLDYGLIGDCGIIVFDINLEPIFLSENKVEVLEKFRTFHCFSKDSDAMTYWRKNVRNKPRAGYMTYGALTGEAEALEYLIRGRIRLNIGDTVLFFSDGIYPFIFDIRFRNYLRERLKRRQGFFRIGEYIGVLLPDLKSQNISNLDDDKALVAVAIN